MMAYEHRNEIPDKSEFGRVLIVPNFILILLGLITPNLETSLTSILTLNILFFLFYKPGIPLVVLGGLLFQWLEISIKVWHANLLFQSFEEMFSLYGGHENMERAFYLSSIGLMAMSLGIYVVLRNIDSNAYFLRLKTELESYDQRKIMIAYIIITIGLSLLLRYRLALPGINTILVAIGKLKWGFFLLYFFTVVQGHNKMKVFILILLFEVVISLAGFFSDFKYFVIYLFIGFLSFTSLISPKRLIFLIPVVIFTFQFGVIWTAVKSDYRSFLSGETSTQRVVVSRQEALGMLWDLIQDVDDETYEESINYLVDRVSFIEFFSLTLDQVPANIPYEEGKIWSEALTFYLKPRMFFPDKPVIDDSEHTSKYTGLNLATGVMGASHSIGFMTDSYIDYGPVMMHIPIFFLGVAIGWLFRFFLLKSHNATWGLIFTGPFFLLVSFFSFNLIKVIGNLFIFIVVALLLKRFIIKLIDPFLKSKS